MVELIKVENEDIFELAQLASSIWHEYWVKILSFAQIEYMIEKFQSENAIRNQIKHENYTYFFIKAEGETIGYVGVSLKADYLFLSKFYIKHTFRHCGYGTQVFEMIKDFAYKNRRDRIRLTVNKYNTNTITAYLSWGFEMIDSVETEIGEGFIMDDYIMEYHLTLQEEEEEVEIEEENSEGLLDTNSIDEDL